MQSQTAVERHGIGVELQFYIIAAQSRIFKVIFRTGVRYDFYFRVRSDCLRLGQRFGGDFIVRLGIYEAESARYILKGAVKRERAVFLKAGGAGICEYYAHRVIRVYIAESHCALNGQSFIRNNRRTVNFHAACFKTTVGSYGYNSVFAGNNRSFTENTPGRFTSLHGFSESGRSYRNSSVFRLVISDVVYLFDRTEIQRQFRTVSGNGKLRVGVCNCELHRRLLHSRVREVVFIGTITHISKP